MDPLRTQQREFSILCPIFEKSTRLLNYIEIIGFCRGVPMRTLPGLPKLPGTRRPGQRVFRDTSEEEKIGDASSCSCC